ncbi:MAG: hypothetical protein H3C27_10735 [Opitutaceae bacterium]|nr:hypothetical protein [Opitutaceae bacterium]
MQAVKYGRAGVEQKTAAWAAVLRTDDGGGLFLLGGALDAGFLAFQVGHATLLFDLFVILFAHVIWIG